MRSRRFCSAALRYVRVYCRLPSKKRKRASVIPDSNWQTLSKSIGAKPAPLPAPVEPAAPSVRRDRSLGASNLDYIKAPLPPGLINAGLNPDAVATKFLAIDCEMVLDSDAARARLPTHCTHIIYSYTCFSITESTFRAAGCFADCKPLSCISCFCLLLRAESFVFCFAIFP